MFGAGIETIGIFQIHHPVKLAICRKKVVSADEFNIKLRVTKANGLTKSPVTQSKSTNLCFHVLINIYACCYSQTAAS